MSVLAGLCGLLAVVFPRPGVPAAEKGPSVSTTYRQVKAVYDGDTVRLDHGEIVRFLGIDAPEVDHAGGGGDGFMARAAWRFNRSKVQGVQVRLEFDSEGQDRYGRRLAYVFLGDGTMINALLVRKGLAHVMIHGPNLKYRDLLLGCQREAMEERLGIWRQPVTGKDNGYLGNRRSFRFHAPGCRFGRKISKKNLVWFKTRHAAFWEGYSPCRHCCP